MVVAAAVPLAPSLQAIPGFFASACLGRADATYTGPWLRHASWCSSADAARPRPPLCGSRLQGAAHSCAAVESVSNKFTSWIVLSPLQRPASHTSGQAHGAELTCGKLLRRGAARLL